MLASIARVLNLTEEEVLHHPHLLINAFDDEHRVLFWNKNCEEYFGISECRALGNLLEDIVPHARDNPKMKILDSALLGKTVFVADNKYDKRNARYTQIVLPLKDSKGKVVAAVNIVRTIQDTDDDWVNKLLASSTEKIQG